MRPILPGDRGPAVEDIQRRLRLLGYDLGPTGIDGVFLGRTAEAIRAFQADAHLAEDGVVGEKTWSALVDATFAPGDRNLYLRLPYFHGNDVRILQQALNALGFACGEVDGIFGPYTERALAEFQRNAGLVVDGIAGGDTVRAIRALRHVWEGKKPIAHSAAHVSVARAEEVLSHLSFAVCGLDAAGREVAERMVNLARATTGDARVFVTGPDAPLPADVTFRLCAAVDGTMSASQGRPVVKVEPLATLAARLLTAFESVGVARPDVVAELGTLDAGEELELQRCAVHLLDALCVVFDRTPVP